MGCKMCHLTNFFSSKQQIKIPYNEFMEALIRTVCIETNDSYVRRTFKKDILISYMGVGEPLMNVDLIKDVFLNNKLYEFGYENISYALATMFPNEHVFDELFDVVKKYHMPLKIHYSMHFPDDANRKELIPASTTNLDTILSKLDEYVFFVENDLCNASATNFQRFHKHGPVEIHYTLIKDVNDHQWCYEKIEEILSRHNFGIKFINFNEVGDMKQSQKLESWIDGLSRLFYSRVKFYVPPGKSIGSSCGEFTKHFFIDTETEKDKNDFDEWKKKYEVNDVIVKKNESDNIKRT